MNQSFKSIIHLKTEYTNHSQSTLVTRSSKWLSLKCDCFAVLHNTVGSSTHKLNFLIVFHKYLNDVHVSTNK